MEMRGGVTDAGRRWQTVKIQLLSQLKLEAEFRKNITKKSIKKITKKSKKILEKSKKIYKKSKTNHREIQKKITKMQTCKLIFVRVWTRSEKNGCYKPRVSFFNILSYQRSHSIQNTWMILLNIFPPKTLVLLNIFPSKHWSYYNKHFTSKKHMIFWIIFPPKTLVLLNILPSCIL